MGAILALVAMLFFVFVGGLHPTCSSKAWATIVGLGFCLLHQRNYLFIGKLTERFINEVLSDALSNRKSPPVPKTSQSSQPMVTFVDL